MEDRPYARRIECFTDLGTVTRSLTSSNINSSGPSARYHSVSHISHIRAREGTGDADNSRGHRFGAGTRSYHPLTTKEIFSGDRDAQEPCRGNNAASGP